MRPLPSLTALQAFEATARRLSVRHAAEELHVSPGAVSRQVKLLEQYFGMALVRRAGRGIALTERGKAYYEALSGPFAGLRKAGSVLTQGMGRTVINLRSHTTFATYWLLPRLAPFQLANPDIEVRLSMASEWSDLGELDAAIRLGSGSWPNLIAIPL
ncbi:MAG: LysR family transcriptional regulator, partial [Rhodospirillum sp.]|nr:LysR family transcriptional regulator [Rhodospirillum sp.]